jgi:hypothetical protein
MSLLEIVIIICGVIFYLRHSKQEKRGKVFLPPFFAILGAISTTIFLIPATITAFADGGVWISFVFHIMSMLGASLIVGFVNCRISYDEEGFIAKNFLGIKRKFTFDQVTAISEDKSEKYVYLGRQKVMVDALAMGGKDFIKQVKIRYTATHHGKMVPRINKGKNDLFNGNIKNASHPLFAYILLSVILTGLLVFAVVATYFAPNSPDTTTQSLVSFHSCYVTEDEVFLNATDGQIYKIRFIDEKFSLGAIQAICDGEKVVQVYAQRINPDHKEPFYSVKAIVYNDNYVLSFEETSRLHSQEYQLLVIFVAIFCALYGVWVAGSIIVGRNPKKYKKWFVRLFFKDEYVKY